MIECITVLVRYSDVRYIGWLWGLCMRVSELTIVILQFANWYLISSTRENGVVIVVHYLVSMVT